MRPGWVPLFALALLLVAPGALAYHGQPGQAGLVVDGPVDVDGLIHATASPGAALWALATNFDATLSARRITVETVSWQESAGALSILEPDRTTREHSEFESPSVRVWSLGDAFQFLVFQSGPSMVSATTSEGGRFVPHPPGGVAPTIEAQRDGLRRFAPEDSFLWGLKSAGARLEADAPAVAAQGDFTLFLYDGAAQIVDTARSTTVRTGASDDARSVKYALIHVQGGRLDVAPSEGFVALYGGVIDAHLNGTARLASARGSATVGGEQVIAQGPTALVGVLDASLYPTQQGERLRMEASGDLAAFSVPGTTHVYAPNLVLPLSLTVLLVAAAVWFFKAGGAAALYSRITGPDVLDHNERERALGIVRERPGTSVADLAEALDISWSTASYHLTVLEREGMLVSERRGRHRRYVLVGSGVDRAEVALAAHPTARAILDAIGATPGVSQTDVAERAGVTPSTASWHLKRLVAGGLVLVEKRWRTAHYTLPKTESMP